MPPSSAATAHFSVLIHSVFAPGTIIRHKPCLLPGHNLRPARIAAPLSREARFKIALCSRKPEHAAGAAAPTMQKRYSACALRTMPWLWGNTIGFLVRKRNKTRV